MARYTGPTCRKARRVGFDLELKSITGRTLGDKCKPDQRPGMHGLSQTGRGRVGASDFRLQLTEKQKLRFMYGVLERQFAGYFKKARRQRGSTALNLLLLLERRLDNVIYRLGLASTRAEARQLVSHCAVLVDGKKVNIPSYLVDPGQQVSIAPGARQQARVLSAIEMRKQFGVGDWLAIDDDGFGGKLSRLPERDEFASGISEQLVVELYSK